MRIDMEGCECACELWPQEFMMLENGVPSHGMFSRLFKMLAPSGPRKALLGLAQSWADRLGGVVAVARCSGCRSRTLRNDRRRARNRAVICSQLFHDAHMEATGRTLVQRADVDVLPAELSACSDLSDVSTGWARLP